VLAATAPAPAQALQRLTVQSFELGTDTPAPRVDVPFHLVVTLRVRERAAQIEDLDLPVLAQLELLGDERETTSGPRGTYYRETIAVVAHDSGLISVAPATLQAIDARDGKAKEWFTNSLTLRVIGAPSVALGNGAHILLAAGLGALRLVVWLLLWAIGIGCIVAIVLILVRRRRVAIIPNGAAPTPPPVVRSRRDQAQDALAVLQAERTRAAAIRVRGAIWRMVGASNGETLADVLRRPDSHDPTMRALLIALERSAFTYDSDLHAAIEDACSALARYIEEGA
jgi:hypothetical protein